MRFRARVALIDIEGTVGSIAFVRDVLFPYASARIDAYVREHESDPAVREILDQTARETGVERGDLPALLRALHDWSDRDVKVTPLKQLQGLIWVEGFESSGLRGHLYPDAIDALRRFHDAGASLYIYSSGSVAAQKLLFGHSVAGDLLALFSGFYDTTIGGKREARSYERIVNEIGVAPSEVIFFSDNVAELDAARAAGVQTVQLARPEDETVPTTAHPSTASFERVELTT
ncbi:MAG TPA: acireductone synthase [Candidatus Baltobacteraceae bacterium]|nr:acireductone synthase [Candidatus Baltobacteraceae bacterium]